MKAVIETSSGKALYLFDPDDVVDITDDGMVGPMRALDIRPETHSVIDTPMPVFWVGGGVLAWEGSWRVVDQAAYDAAFAVIHPVASYPALTRKQLRNGLLSIGVTSAEVEAQIAAIPDPLEREAAMIDWQDTDNYQRDYPLIAQIGGALGLPEEQIDALWLWSAGQ